MRKLSPGFFWLAVLAWAVYSVYKKFDTGTLYNYSFEYGFFLFLLIASSAYTYYYDKTKKKDTAVAAFILSLTFWIPLLNLIFCALGFYLGIRSWRKIKQNPKTFGGKWFIIVAFILTVFVYITYLTGVGMCVFGFKTVCANIGLTFLAD